MDVDETLDSAQKIAMLVEALKAGRLKLRPQDDAWARELHALPRGIEGLPDISLLSPQALAMAKAVALFFSNADDGAEAFDEAPLSTLEAQCILFGHLNDIFVALTGASPDTVKSTAEIKNRMIERMRSGSSAMQDDFNAAAGELEQFYRVNTASMFRAAKTLGGSRWFRGDNDISDRPR
jgi:hypothetical protein